MGPAPGLHLPEEVQGYHSLVPMELPTQDKKKFNNWNCVMYKATKIEDGRTYALRRIESMSHHKSLAKRRILNENPRKTSVL